jgi:L-lactate utilization protein LutB
LRSCGGLGRVGAAAGERTTRRTRQIWTTRADVATAQERVEELRTDLEHIRDNPVDYLGQVGKSIDEVIHNAETTLAANGLQPIDADDAATRWINASQWRQTTEQLLPNNVLKQWWDSSRRKHP